MRVWRIAHSTVVNPDTGMPNGPYSSWAFSARDMGEVRDFLWTLGSAHNDDDHPSPYQDGYLRTINPHEICGCDSIESTRQWFDGWIDELRTHGFVLEEYDAEDVRIGKVGGQVVFSKNTAELVTVHDLSILVP